MSSTSHSGPTVVLKFGSSVLRSAADLPSVVSEIYRHVRRGEHVVAVISAFAGVTDRILAASRMWIPKPNPEALANAVATGEVESATQLVFALERSGIPVSFLDPRDVSLRARGERLNAEPVSIDVIRLRQIVEHQPVTVVPGFYGLAEGHGIALLGRGGSDLTATYLAQHLRARCILVKDVDGLYESDPAQSGERPRRFEAAHFDDALRLGNELVQPKAIESARAANQRIEIRAIGERAGTVIGGDASTLLPSRAPERLRVLLCGLGTVGRGIYEYLIANPQRYELAGILVKDPLKHVKAGVPAELLLLHPTDALHRALDRNVDVVVEALGGLDPAYRLTLAALAAGREVITSNKELLATHWDSLSPYLLSPTPKLRASAAVGGAVPMMELVQRLVSRGEAIEEIRGVVNGTCNFVLDRLAAKVPFNEAVSEAQAAGYAELDPSADLDGIDAARKIDILCRLAYGERPERLRVRGICEADAIAAAARNSASSTPGTYRLVARVAEDRRARVVPELLPDSDYLAHTRGAENRLEVATTSGTVHRISGLGAGRYPTATAILADLLDVSLARQDRLGAG
jgi:homoserine dehydrogenase